MKSDYIRLKCDPAYRVWAEVSQEALAAFVAAPQAFLTEAAALLNQHVASGAIKVYEIHAQRLTNVWRQLLAHPEVAAVRFVLGAGLPELTGVALLASEESRAPTALLTVAAEPALVRTWHVSWLILAVGREWQRLGLPYTPNPATIEALWLRAACHGERILESPLSLAPRHNPKHEGRKHIVRAFRNRGEVDVVIGEAKGLESPEVRASVVMVARRALEELAATSEWCGAIRYDSVAFTKRLAILAHGPERLGLELPASLCFGIAYQAPSRHGRAQASLDWSLDLALRLRSLVPGSPQAPRKDVAEWPLPPDLEQAEVLLSELGWLDEHVSAPPYFRAGSRGDEEERTMLKLADLAIQHVPSQRRSVQALTLAMTESEAGVARERLESLRQSAVDLSQAVARPDRLVALNFQLFPLTREQPDFDALALAENRQPLADDAYEWVPSLLRELTNLGSVRQDSRWVAAKLYPYVPEAVIKRAFEALVRLGHVALDSEAGRFVPMMRDVRTADNVGGEMVQRFHARMLGLANGALGFAPEERSSFVFMRLRVDEATFKVLADLVMACLNEVFTASSQAQAADQIYQLNLQMFPLAP
jgi:hypothetical protein